MDAQNVSVKQLELFIDSWFDKDLLPENPAFGNEEIDNLLKYIKYGEIPVNESHSNLVNNYRIIQVDVRPGLLEYKYLSEYDRFINLIFFSNVLIDSGEILAARSLIDYLRNEKILKARDIFFLLELKLLHSSEEYDNFFALLTSTPHGNFSDKIYISVKILEISVQLSLKNYSGAYSISMEIVNKIDNWLEYTDFVTIYSGVLSHLNKTSELEDLNALLIANDIINPNVPYCLWLSKDFDLSNKDVALSHFNFISKLHEKIYDLSITENYWRICITLGFYGNAFLVINKHDYYYGTTAETSVYRLISHFYLDGPSRFRLLFFDYIDRDRYVMEKDYIDFVFSLYCPDCIAHIPHP